MISSVHVNGQVQHGSFTASFGANLPQQKPALVTGAEISSIESTFPVKLHHKLVADRHIEVDTKYRASISSTGRRK